jgi:general secretion pathway protein C
MLDLFFRKYAWTANLVLLLAAAWLTAKTVNTLVGAVIRPRPSAELNAPAPPPPRALMPVALDTDKLYRLIGVEPPKEQDAAGVPGPPPSPQNCSDADARPVKSDLRFKLVASVLAERPQSSLASITDPGSNETRVLGVGDELNGVRLLGVQRVKDDHDATGNAVKVVAIVCNGGTKEYLDSEGGSSAPESPPNLGIAPVPGRPPVAMAAAPGAPLQGVRCSGDNRCDVDRSVVEKSLNNMNDLATQARIVPSFENGVANGFKLFSIQPGSLYASLGIENGDVIQRINGYEINSPDKALEIYSKLKESSHVTVDIKRSGQPIRKDINIAGP